MKKPFNQRLHKINNEVKFPIVRLLTEGGSQLMSSYEAYQMSINEGKDLILINETQNPPTVKIEDYNKFIYNIKKQKKENLKNSIKSETKELQFSCDIADHDLNTKAKKAYEFLEKGKKVKCVLQLKGRQKSTPERGQIILLKYASLLENIGVPESMPKLDGGRWTMMMKPKK